MINDLQDVEPQPWDLPPAARSEQPRRRLPRLTWMFAAAAAVIVIAAMAEVIDGNSDDDTEPTSSPSGHAGVTNTDRDHRTSPSQTPSSGATTPEPPPSYRVIRVVSGDTVQVAYQGRATVRVIGIATPTIVKRGSFAECTNNTASKYASRLLDGAEVMLRAIQPTGSRVLARIELGGGDRDFGLAMIRHGYAIHDPTTDLGRLAAAYRMAEADAKAAHRGLWGHCKSLVPDLTAEDSSATENSQEPRDESQETRGDTQNQNHDEANADSGCDPGYLDGLACQ